MITRRNPRTARIGIFAVAHGTYWSQFPGLEEKIMGYHHDAVKMVEQMEVTVVDYGMIDTSEKAYKVSDVMKGDRLDLVICNMVTYATSSVFAPIIRDVAVPMILLAAQPLEEMDYSRACTFMQLENDCICSVPEFVGVANRLGKKIRDVVIGTLYNDEIVLSELKEWCEIAKVLHDLKGARLGLMGHVMEAMYDMHADPTAVSAAFGCHVPLLEIEDAVTCFEAVTDKEIQEKKAIIKAEFLMPDPKSDPVTVKLTDEDLQVAAKTAAALDRLVEKFHLSGLAYYYEGRENTIQRLVSSSFIVGNSILNAEGIPMCGEYDLKTLVAMLIMDRLDIGGSFAEFHPFGFKENYILVGHDGPHHMRVAEGKPVLRSLLKYHGKPGHGASVEFKLKEGPITMLGITQKADGKFKFVIGEGLSQEGAIPPTGNTNTRGVFLPDTRTFIKRWVMEGPTHHYALGIGHRADTIQKIANILGIDSVIVR